MDTGLPQKNIPPIQPLQSTPRPDFVAMHPPPLPAATVHFNDWLRFVAFDPDEGEVPEGTELPADPEGWKIVTATAVEGQALPEPLVFDGASSSSSFASSLQPGRERVSQGFSATVFDPVSSPPLLAPSTPPLDLATSAPLLDPLSHHLLQTQPGLHASHPSSQLEPSRLPSGSPSLPDPIVPLVFKPVTSEQTLPLLFVPVPAPQPVTPVSPPPPQSPPLWTHPISPSPQPPSGAEYLPHPPCPTYDLAPNARPARKERRQHVPRNLKRLTTVEEPASCNSCHAPTATLLLHGPASAIALPHAMSLTCRSCDAAAALDRSTLRDTPSGSTTKKKKRPVGVEGPLSCSACKEEVGVGVMRMVDVDGDRVGRREDWVEPGFSLEPVYIVSTGGMPKLCGGGGHFRTGRWRPNQLFSPNRKTCNLSHDRVGLLAFTRQVFTCAQDLPPSLVPALIAFWADCSYKRFAEAKFMETRTVFSDFAKLEARVHETSEEVRVRLCAPLKPGTRRYACVTWGDPTASTRRAAAALKAPATAENTVHSPGPTPGREMVQFHLAEWFIEDGIVYFAHGLGIMNVAAVYLACHRELLDFIIADAAASSLPAPQHAMQLHRASAAEIDKDDLDLPHPENGLGWRRARTYVARQAAAGREPVDLAVFAPDRFEATMQAHVPMAVGVQALMDALEGAVGGRRRNKK
ncbi:hypothetical protein BDK51DRAFT_25887 [Blyttiomyces helicus]|uniref:Uncharacterized protein n=1 Tax=Blyttiomyces helicus TaxID=388810 RepID=A0A4P9W3K9_9FUNG|nr:hypothetical protein BDK51DRAFT_25887 [Blyttiomyces helicus]|eukprot:RKO85250.1 hypothetical protein BDK51DRAFT_25887 [Blyttiomyces helicus]